MFPITSRIEPPKIESRRRIELPGATGRGGRTRIVSNDQRGVYRGVRQPRSRPTDLALDATVRAAAPHQVSRQSGDESGLAVNLRPSDLREKRRHTRVRNLVVFVVDSSGSMGAYERMSAVKGAILSLLEDAYQKREYVSLIGFRKDGAETLLPPTSSVSHAARELAEMPTGGRTPVAAGLEKAFQVVKREQTKNTSLVPVLVLITDGRSNNTGTSTVPIQHALDQAERIGDANVPAICFDTETGPVRIGVVRNLADRMGATYYRFDDLEPGTISETVRDIFPGAYQHGG